MAVQAASAAVVLFSSMLVFMSMMILVRGQQPLTVFQFGDSLADTGNSIILFPDCSKMYSRPPYGMTFFRHATGRVSDGRLLIDFIASSLGLPFLNPSLKAGTTNYAYGANFAVGGATAMELEFFRQANMSHPPRRVSLGTQLDWFRMFQRFATINHMGIFPTPVQFSRALYIVGEIGGNDYFAMFQSGISFTDMLKFVPYVVQAVETILNGLYEEGAREFLVINVPIQGCNPFYLASVDPEEERDEFGCLTALNKVGALHQSMLRTMVERLRRDLPDATFAIADYHGLTTQIIQNFQQYGFKHNTKACCGIYETNKTIPCGGTENGTELCNKPSEFIFWNDNHFTDQFYKIAAAHFLSGKFIDPPNALQSYTSRTWDH